MKNLKFIGVIILFISMMAFSEIASAQPHHRHARHAIRRHHWAMCHRPVSHHQGASRRYHGRHQHDNHRGRHYSDNRRRHH